MIKNKYLPLRTGNDVGRHWLLSQKIWLGNFTVFRMSNKYVLLNSLPLYGNIKTRREFFTTPVRSNMYAYIILGVYIFLCWIFILHGWHGSLFSWERILWHRPSLESESLCRVWLFVTPWTIQSMDFSRQARILEWVAYPFSSGSSQPRNRTRVSCIAGRFFTDWGIKEAQIIA